MVIGSRDIDKEYLRLEAVAHGKINPRTLVKRVRDLILIDLLGGINLVIACDSNAAIGEKPMDSLKQPYAEMGRSAVKVPLMEVIAVGATPIVVVDALCVEMEPSGKKIIEAIRGELERAGLSASIEFTGSTEDNAETVQSGIGMTVIGLATSTTLRLGRTQSGDAVVCVGIPKSGYQIPYRENDEDNAHVSTVVKLNSLDYVHEILPIVSIGAWYEAGDLAAYVGIRVQLVDADLPFDLNASAGASTAVLVSLNPGDIDRLRTELIEPVFIIGQII